MATRFFLGVAAASPGAAWGEGGTGTDPGDAFASLLGTASALWDAFVALLGAVPVPRVLWGIARLASETCGRVERGVVAGVLRGLLPPTAP